jgi:predicted transcriptional regulator
MAKTERAAYRAAVKAYADGTPFLAFEPMSENMEFLDGALAALELKQGTTPEEAREVADVLDRFVVGLAVTKFQD